MLSLLLFGFSKFFFSIAFYTFLRGSCYTVWPTESCKFLKFSNNWARDNIMFMLNTRYICRCYNTAFISTVSIPIIQRCFLIEHYKLTKNRIIDNKHFPQQTYVVVSSTGPLFMILGWIQTKQPLGDHLFEYLTKSVANITAVSFPITTPYMFKAFHDGVW